MIQKLQKGQKPTLLQADKGNELIDDINSLTNMVVKRGGDQDKFVFGKQKSTLHLQDFPKDSGSSGTLEIDSADESVQITEIPDEPTDLKAITLNGIKAKNAILRSPNLSVDVDTIGVNNANPEIHLKAITLNNIKAKNIILDSNDQSIEVDTDIATNEIDLKGLTLNGIRKEDAEIISEDNSIEIDDARNLQNKEVALASNLVALKGFTLNGIKAKDANLDSDNETVIIEEVDIDTDNPKLNLKSLSLNGIKATEGTVSGDGITTINTVNKDIQVYVPPPIKDISTAEVDFESENESVSFTKKTENVDFKALRINEWGARDVNIESSNNTNQIEKKESIDGAGNTIYKLQINGFDLNGIGANRATLEVGTGLEINTAGQTITISIDGYWQDIVVCENGVQRTMKVLVKNEN